MTDSTNPLQPAQEARKAHVKMLIASFFQGMSAEEQEKLLTPSVALIDQFNNEGFVADANSPEVVQIHEIAHEYYGTIIANQLAIRNHMTAYILALQRTQTNMEAVEEFFQPSEGMQIVEMGFGGPMFGDGNEFVEDGIYDEISVRVNGYLEAWLAGEMIFMAPQMTIAQMRFVATVLADAGMEGQDLVAQDSKSLKELFDAARLADGQTQSVLWQDSDIQALMEVLKRFDAKWKATECFFVDQEVEHQLATASSPEKIELLVRIRAANEKLLRCSDPEQSGGFYEEISELFDQFENTGDANVGDVAGLMATYPKDVH